MFDYTKLNKIDDIMSCINVVKVEQGKKGIILSKKWSDDLIKYLLPRDCLAHGTRNSEKNFEGLCVDGV